MQDPQPQHCSRMLRILAEPERLRIIHLLSQKPQSVGELAKALGKHLVRVSHHLRVLREAGIVIDSRQGRFIIYQLSENFYQPASKLEMVDHLDLGCCRIEFPK